MHASLLLLDSPVGSILPGAGSYVADTILMTVLDDGLASARGFLVADWFDELSSELLLGRFSVTKPDEDKTEEDPVGVGKDDDDDDGNA